MTLNLKIGSIAKRLNDPYSIIIDKIVVSGQEVSEWPVTKRAECTISGANFEGVRTNNIPGDAIHCLKRLKSEDLDCIVDLYFRF